MDEADGRCGWIDNVNGTTVGYMNAERDPSLIGDEPVRAGEMFVRLYGKIDNCNLITMDLLGRQQRPIADTDGAPNFCVRRVQTLQHLFFVMRNIDARNAAREDVATDFDCFERRKLLERKPRVSAIRWSCVCRLRSCHCSCRRLTILSRAARCRRRIRCKRFVCRLRDRIRREWSYNRRAPVTESIAPGSIAPGR